MSEKLCFAIICTSLLSTASAKANTITIWERPAGLHAEGREVKKLRPKKITLQHFRKARQSLFDVQSEMVKVFRVVPLTQILKKFKTNRNLALLHFDNGMIVPVAEQPQEPYTYEASRVVVATAVLKQKKWSKEFANIERKGLSSYEKDPTPTTIIGNKPILTLTKKHFYSTDKKGVKWLRFTPWAHTNALRGIEFVDHDAYYKQFDLSPAQKAGFEVYKERCQYCHGLQAVGASYGWDFIDPVKVASKRDATNIHMFVKYPKLQPFRSKMPNQLDFTATEAQDVWSWLDAVSGKNVRPYKY